MSAPQTSSETLSVRAHASMADIPQEDWDRLLTPDAIPFLQWEFLNALEGSASAIPLRGWTPCHFTLWRGQRLVAGTPGYVKTHSMGEFMYNDFRWAEFTPRLGVSYYPKLILGVAFSPATGPRPLVAPEEDRAAIIGELAAALKRHVIQDQLSSVGVLFARESDLPAWEAAGFAHGAGVQYHWNNQGFRSFDDFLGRFNSKRRHMLKSERAQLARDSTVVRNYRGEELTPDLMEFVARCYEHTFDKKAWNDPHLTPTFFHLARERFPDRVDVVVAEENGRRLGCAFNLRGHDRLFGRHWGALEDRRFLHFNVCYYHSIERCIAEGLNVFEPGAGGEHKLVRGFEPTPVHSLHWFVNPRLQQLMSQHLAREVAAYQAHIDEVRSAGLAFKGGTAPP